VILYPIREGLPVNLTSGDPEDDPLRVAHGGIEFEAV
jgi:hypothetical protein